MADAAVIVSGVLGGLGIVSGAVVPQWQARQVRRTEHQTWLRNQRVSVLVDTVTWAQTTQSQLARLDGDYYQRDDPDVAHPALITARMRLLAPPAAWDAWDAWDAWESLVLADDNLRFEIYENHPDCGQPAWIGLPADDPHARHLREALAHFFQETQRAL